MAFKIKEALDVVKKEFPEKFISVEVEVSRHQDDEEIIVWKCYAGEWGSGRSTFEEAFKELKKELEKQEGKTKFED